MEQANQPYIVKISTSFFLETASKIQQKLALFLKERLQLGMSRLYTLIP